MTRDGDVYEEPLAEPSGDISAVRYAMLWWPPPAGVPRNRTYRYARNAPASERRDWQALAAEEAATTWEQETCGPPTPGALRPTVGLHSVWRRRGVGRGIFSGSEASRRVHRRCRAAGDCWGLPGSYRSRRRTMRSRTAAVAASSAELLGRDASAAEIPTLAPGTKGTLWLYCRAACWVKFATSCR